MSKVRINDLARELAITSSFILAYLPKIGVTEKKSHSSSVEDSEAVRLRTFIRDLTPNQDADVKKEIQRRREELERKWAQEAIAPPRAPTTVSPRVQPEERPRAHVPADSHAMHEAPASPSPPSSPAVPKAIASAEDWARDLASARRLILKLLNEIEGTMGSSEEKISKRINDLSFQRKIPRYIRTLMFVLVDYRNEVEYNDYMPTEVESVTIDGAWQALTEWAVKKCLRTSLKMGAWPTHVPSK